MMIKRELIFAVLTGLVLVCTSCSRQERIIKVADLPDTPEFEVDAQPQFTPTTMGRKVHVDVGYIWTQNKLLVFPLLNLDGRYVGYTGDEFNYIELKQEQLEKWTIKAHVRLTKHPSIPFWDAWGGKLALLAVLPPFIFLSLLVDRLWRRFSTGMWDSD